jgi:hypothetical protein
MINNIINNNMNNNIDIILKKYNINNITLDFYKIYYDLLILKDENIFINDLIVLSEKYNICEFVRIKNIQKLIFHLDTLHLQLCYKILLYLFIKSELHNYLICYFNKTCDDIYKAANILEQHINYIKSFNLVMVNEFNDIQSLCSWQTETKYELIERIKLLYKHFTYKFFRKYDIKIIPISYLFDISFCEINKYYDNLISQLRTTFEEHINTVSAYMEIDTTLSMTLLFKSHYVKLKKYKIIVR